jgi:hypothetical protein
MTSLESPSDVAEPDLALLGLAGGGVCEQAAAASASRHVLSIARRVLQYIAGRSR